MALFAVLGVGLFILGTALLLTAGWTAYARRTLQLRLSGAVLAGFFLALIHQYFVVFLTLSLTPASLTFAYILLFAGSALPLLWSQRAGLRNLGTATRMLVGQSTRAIRQSPWVLLTGLVPLFAMGMFLIYAWIFPPTGFDDYVYHLPFTEMVVQRHALGFFPFPIAHSYAQTYPKFVELLLASSGLALGRLHALALWNFFALGGVGAALVYAARLLQLSKRDALSASLVGLACPVLLMLSTTAKADLYFALAAFAGAVFAADYASQRETESRRGPLVGLFCSMAILLAAKPNGLASAPFLLVTAIAGRRWISGRWPRLQELRHERLLLGALFLMTSYWYLRNLFHFGNPVFPIAVTLPILGKLPGTLSMAAFYNLGEFDALSLPMKWLHNWFELKGWAGVFYIHDGRFSGLGPLWPIFFLPGLLAGLYLAAQTRLRVALFLFTVGVGSFLVTPMNWYPRYSFAIVLFGAVAWTWTLHHLFNGRTKTWLQIATWVLASWSYAASVPNTYFSARLVIDQLRSLRQPIPAIASFKLNGLKHYLSDQAARRTSELRIGFDTQAFYSALRPWQRIGELTYLDVEEENGNFEAVLSRPLDYVHVTLDSPLNRWLAAHPEHFLKLKDTEDYPHGVLYEVRQIP